MIAGVGARKGAEARSRGREPGLPFLEGGFCRVLITLAASSSSTCNFPFL